MRAERHVIQPHPSNIKHREPKQNVQLVELRDECGIAVRGNTEIVVDNKKIVSVSEQMDNYKWRGWSEGSTALLPAISVAKVSTTRLRS